MGFSSSKLFLNKRLDGKTAVITGCNTGIGKETVKELHKLGARVIMACRDMSKANEAVAIIRNEVRPNEKTREIIVKELDLASFESIRKCAEEINNSENALDFLINNAGVMMCPKSKTKEGFETHFGVNHLGHFLFTCLLLPKIMKSAPSKIINISSVAHERSRMDWADLNFENKPYSALNAYGQSKLANILFTRELSRRLEGTGVTVFALHPGIVRTELGRYMDDTYFRGARLIGRTLFRPFSISPEEGAKTTLYCILADNEHESGSYYSNCQLKEPSTLAKNDEDAKKLWSASLKLVNINYDPIKVNI